MTISRRNALVLALAPLGVVATGRMAWAQAGSGKAAPVKIGIIGSGHIGGTLGGLWVKAGHSVMFSSRHPETLAAMAQELGPLASTGTPLQAAAFGDAVLLAIPYKAMAEVGHDLAGALAGKTVLDATNATAGRDGAEIAADVKARGIGVVSAGYFPGAHLVRVFNSMGAMKMAKDNHRDPLVALPLAGDDPAAMAVAAQLVRDAGFEPVPVGGIGAAAKFQMGTPGYDASQEELTAPVLLQRLGV